jgi:hypothetical protein
MLSEFAATGASVAAAAALCLAMLRVRPLHALPAL